MPDCLGLSIRTKESSERRRDGAFSLSLDAVDADFYAFATDTGPLEIHIALGTNGGIIMTAEKNARSGHSRFFTALRASGHSVLHITSKLLFLQE